MKSGWVRGEEKGRGEREEKGRGKKREREGKEKRKGGGIRFIKPSMSKVFMPIFIVAFTEFHGKKVGYSALS